MGHKPGQPGTGRTKPDDRDEGYSMVAYEFYWRDEAERVHFIGILPERRKKTERITQESVLNWGMKVIGDTSGINDIYFVQVEF